MTQSASISLSNLKRALKVVEPAIAKGAACIPILHSVRMEQLADGLAIEATNLEIAIRALVPESNGPKAATVIPSERLLQYTKLLKGEDVKITTGDNGRVTFSCGRARGVFPIMPAGNWPDTANVFKLAADGVTLNQGKFARALRIAQIVTADDDVKPELTAVLINGDGKHMQVVGCTGYSLAVYTFPSDQKISNLLMPGEFIRALLPLLTSAEDGVDLAFNDRIILASVAGEVPVFVSGKQMAARFPSWKSVLPKDERQTITTNAGDLMETIERVSVFKDAKSNLLIFHFGDAEGIVVEGKDSEAGEGREAVACEGECGALKHHVNADFIRPILRKLAGPLSFAVPSDNTKPFKINAQPHDGETLEFIVMPLRG